MAHVNCLSTAVFLKVWEGAGFHHLWILSGMLNFLKVPNASIFVVLTNATCEPEHRLSQAEIAREEASRGMLDDQPGCGKCQRFEYHQMGILSIVQ